MIAAAVPKASLPIRNTTVLPPFSTPVASANTFGRPSKTKPITPRGAFHCCTSQPECDTVLSSEVNDMSTDSHILKAAIISVRIFSVSMRRVVERPFAIAAAISDSLATAMEEKRESFANRSAAKAKKRLTCSVVVACNWEKADRAAPTRSEARWLTSFGMRRRAPDDAIPKTTSPSSRDAAKSSSIVTKVVPTRTRSPD